jgi:tetratricopeptide (TPR) repeat protein
VPTKLEPSYAEAVLAYNGKDYNKALTLLDALLHQKPDVTEFLELKALVLKTENNGEESAKVYQDLIAAKKAEQKPEKEIAPYYYELGLIEYRKGDLAGAREHLQSAVSAGFNAAPSEFFLGLMDFREGKWDSAQDHLKETASSNVDELKPAANFYLGQIATKLGQGSTATQRYFDARSVSKDALEDPKSGPEAKKISQQIFDATDKALKPFDKSGYFGTVGVSLGYDTNVISVPDSAISSNPGLQDGKTLKTTLQGGVGYASSPLNPFQFVPSYRGSVNFNFAGGSTSQGQFFTNDLSLYVTRHALARTSWGFKAEPIYTFQDQSGGWGGYSLVVPFGPYFRRELRPNLILNVEFYLAPQDYLTDDPTNTVLARSGMDYNLRVTLKNDHGGRYWNPSYALVFDKNSTKGSEFDEKGVTFEFSDVLRLSEPLSVTGTLDFGGPNYGGAANPNGSIGRQDVVFAVDANAVYRLSARYSLVGDLSYIDNTSNDTTYQFTRFVVSMGASYTF